MKTIAALIAALIASQAAFADDSIDPLRDNRAAFHDGSRVPVLNITLSEADRDVETLRGLRAIANPPWENLTLANAPVGEAPRDVSFLTEDTQELVSAFVAHAAEPEQSAQAMAPASRDPVVAP
ncbi:MAG: hypothetical protein AAFQ84_10295 [Pseudomonadota bacterium]